MACGIGTPLKKRENQKLFAGFVAAVFLCYFVLLNYKYEQVRVANPCLYQYKLYNWSLFVETDDIV